MSSSKIQEYNLDPNMGLAKEESVQEVKTVSDEIKALIGTEIATQLSTLKEEIITAMSNSSSGLTSCIKSLQRIDVDWSTGNNNSNPMYTTISISAVDISKTVVLFNGYAYVTYNDEIYSKSTDAIDYVLNSTSIRISAAGFLSSTLNISYSAAIKGKLQIIEFN